MLNDEQRRDCAAYIMAQAKYVIQTFGPRPPGSAGETQCQRLVQEELSAICDEPAVMTPFPVAQKAFMAFPVITAAILIAGALAFLFSPVLSLALSLVGLFIIVQQLVRYKLLLDPFFPKHTSHNVSGRIAPAGPIKRRVILNGHPDGAYEWRWLYLFPRFFPLFVLVSLGGFLVKLLMDIVAVALIWLAPESTVPGLLAWLHILLIPSALTGFFFSNFNHVAPGANDNLSGTFLAVGVARALRAAGVQLQNTELVIAITGSEEAGLRGAKRYAAEVAERFRDVETIAIALDTIRDLEHLTIYNRDLNGTLPHDPAVCKLLHDAGARCGVDLPYAAIPLGSSDGTAFTQAGIRSAAFCAMDPRPAHYYHNRRDDWDNMDAECLALAAGIIAEALAQYDAEGLPATA